MTDSNSGEDKRNECKRATHGIYITIQNNPTNRGSHDMPGLELYPDDAYDSEESIHNSSNRPVYTVVYSGMMMHHGGIYCVDWPGLALASDHVYEDSQENIHHNYEGAYDDMPALEESPFDDVLYYGPHCQPSDGADRAD